MWFLALVLMAQNPDAEEGRWITTDDYPRTAVVRQEQGIVSYRLNVNERGGVVGCTVIATSVSSVLSDLTCKLLIRRGFYKPAGLPGLEVPSVRDGSYEWKLPPHLMHPETLARELEHAADQLEKEADAAEAEVGEPK